MTIRTDAEARTTASPPDAPACWLSVVIPTHNRRELVLRAVDSVLDQDREQVRRIEIIVVDDGSTDDTVAALHACHGRDPRVCVIHTTNLHASAARNTGFRASRGELVCFLDSDDFWSGRVLASVVQVFALHPELAYLSLEGSTLPSARLPRLPRIVAGDCPGWSHAAFSRARLATEPLRLDDTGEAASLLFGDYFPAIINADLFYLSGMIIRREAVMRAGPFTERFRYYNDWEFFARLCLQGPGAYLDVEGFYRDTGREDQISRGRPGTAMPRRHLYILRSLQWRFPADTRAYAAHLHDRLTDAQYWMGRCLLHARRPRLARRYLRRCIRQRYKTGRSLALFAATFLPRFLAPGEPTTFAQTRE